MGCSPIYLINRDPQETQAVVDHFPDLELIPLMDEATTKAELKKQADGHKRLCVGVGAIPAIDPVTDAEKMVRCPSSSVRMVLKRGDRCTPLPRRCWSSLICAKRGISRASISWKCLTSRGARVSIVKLGS